MGGMGQGVCNGCGSFMELLGDARSRILLFWCRVCHRIAEHLRHRPGLFLRDRRGLDHPRAELAHGAAPHLASQPSVRTHPLGSLSPRFRRERRGGGRARRSAPITS
jgi:hypothetical protein